MRLVEGNVRTAAEVDEFSGGVKRDHRLGGFFFDQLALENLIGFFIELDGFGFRHELALVGEILSGEFVHFVFDFFEIFGSERLLAKKFVEKAGVDRGADAELYVGIKLHHRGGEKMCRGMAKDVERVGIFFGEDLELDVVIERATQVDQFAGVVALVAVVGAERCSCAACLRVWICGGRIGNARDESGVGEARRNFARDIRRSCALGHFLH